MHHPFAIKPAVFPAVSFLYFSTGETKKGSKYKSKSFYISTLEVVFLSVRSDDLYLLFCRNSGIFISISLLS